MGLLEYLFIFLIFSIPLGQIFRIDYQDVGILISDVIAVLIAFVYLVKVFRRRIKHGVTFVPMIIFSSALSLSLAINLFNLKTDQLLVSFSYLVRFMSYISILFVFSYLSKEFREKKLQTILLFSGFLFILLGFFQTFLYPNLRNLYYAGWDEHLYRFFSSFLDPNFAGAFLVLYFIFVLGLFLNQTEGKKKNLLSGLLLLTFISIFTTFSRSAYIMLLISFFIFLFTKKRRKELIIAIVGFLILFLIFFSNSLFGEGTKLLRTASISARFESAEKAIQIFKENPIFGIGFNSYKYAQEKHNFLVNKGLKIRSAAGTDNSFLFILATSGVVGFFAFVYLIFSLLRFSLKKGDRGKVLFVSIIALGVGSLFNNLIFYPFILLWMLILIGITENT
ncbi:MAG: O-antigen ligase family protein [Candidatus Levybacteria bacterium]|nr:O-antigen ligase family protein [Candidatus Levybacteria bacterium]